MVQWRFVRDGNIETDLYDIELTDTANPFGNYCIAYIDDYEGVKAEDYRRGTPVELEFSTDGGLNWTTRFTGYVVEPRETTRQGADSLEIECYSYDQFLRRNTVSQDQSTQTITTALFTIITSDTPVDWNVNNVDVADEQTLTRSYRGERVEDAILDIASKSGSEDWGVNDNLEFFLRDNEVSNAPRNVDNSQWTSHDLETRGKEPLNQIRVYYDNGENSVIVANGADQLDLQSQIGTTDPIEITEEVSYPNITDPRDAREVGERILKQRREILTGTVTTYGLYEAEPGDVIHITINERGIDDDFRIAQIDYQWGTDETVLTVVTKRGHTDDILVSLSDTIKRTELAGVDRDAVQSRVTPTRVGATISGTVTVGSETATGQSVKITNWARNQLRGAWSNQDSFDIDTIAVGTDPTQPVRTDTSLGNQTESATITQGTDGDYTATFDGSVTTTDIREVGVFDSSGNMVARGVVPDATHSSPVSVSIDLTVDDDPEFENGVVTNDGQKTIRDILIDNYIAPNRFGWGTDGTTPAETDSSLTNQITVTNDEIVVQQATTTSGWEDIAVFDDTDPFFIENDNLKLAQSCFVFESENAASGNFTTNFDSSYSNLLANRIAGINDRWTHKFELDYTIPAANVANQIRLDVPVGSDGSNAGFVVRVDGETIAFFPNSTLTSGLGWNLNSGITSDLEPGIHRVDVETVSVGDPVYADVSAVFDDRFTYNFDNTVGASNELDGPELYPDQATLSLQTETTIREFDEAELRQIWDNTSNNQYIEISNDGSNYTRSNNSDFVSATFGGLSNSLYANIAMSRYGSGRGITPADGYLGQEIQETDSTIILDTAMSPEDIGVINTTAILPANTNTGTTVEEAGQLNAFDELQTRSILPPYSIPADQQLIGSENLRFRNG